jgi:hypothetical protein
MNAHRNSIREHTRMARYAADFLSSLKERACCHLRCVRRVPRKTAFSRNLQRLHLSIFRENLSSLREQRRFPSQRLLSKRNTGRLAGA